MGVARRWVVPAVLAGVLLMGGCTEERVDPPSYGVYMGVMLAGEATGRTLWGPAPQLDFPEGTPQCIIDAAANLLPMMMGRSFVTRPFFIGPDLSPDFLDQGVPPFCMGFKWTAADQAPDLNAVDAGAVTVAISGNDAVTGNGVPWWKWGIAEPQETKQPDTPFLDTGKLTTPIVCGRGDHPGGGGRKLYGCPFEPVVALCSGDGVASCPAGTGDLVLTDDDLVLTDDASVDISAAGGANIGAFSETGIKAPAALRPKASFDLNQIDPSQDIVASWESTSANWVMIELFAQVVKASSLPQPWNAETRANRPQSSEFAQVLCLAPADSGSKTIPEGARKLIPMPASAEDLTMIMTTIVGFDVRADSEGWGSYMVGAGRGTLGISCIGADGNQCPQPDFMSILQGFCPAN